MQSPDPIVRQSLSGASEAAVRALIVDGTLAAGERVNEVRLAAKLGVSRTPLREALNRLVAEGAIEARAHHGYFVKALTLEEFEQAYDIRPLLDPEALRLAGLPPPAHLMRLEKLNQKLARTRDPTAAMELDDEWHHALVEMCPNRLLIALIGDMMIRTRRYELALMREGRSITRATEDHERILGALSSGDLDVACAALKDNLKGGKAEIVAWLKSRPAKTDGAPKP